MRVIYTPDEGYFFCELDYNQLELRVGAVIAPEPDALKDLQEGRDIHNELGCIIFGKPEITSRERLITKTVVFGTLYGRSARSIAIQFGVTVAEAEAWQALCINKYSGFLRYRNRSTKELQMNGYLETPFGRRRRGLTPQQGYNFPVQSSASDVTLTSLIRLDQAGFDLRLTVHDSIILQVNDKSEALAAKQVAEQLIKPLNNTSFPTSCKIGKNWYEMEKI
jgi:DNA polymerase-1